MDAGGEDAGFVEARGVRVSLDSFSVLEELRHGELVMVAREKGLVSLSAVVPRRDVDAEEQWL